MAILLPPSVIEKAASRFKKVATLSEQAELESHILNFYEDFNMPMSDLYELIDTIQMGELQEIQEKMDGQNITFTVMDGSLLFFSKGATYKRVLSGAGMDRAGIIEKYSWNDSVRNAFVKAYDALSPVSLQFQDSLFQNGKVLIESALLTPENPNTIVYDEPSIRFIQAAAVAPDTVVDDEAFNEFVSSAESGANQDFHMGSVPYLRLLRALDITDEETGEIKSSIDSLLSQYNLSQENTMGELVHSMVREKLGDSVPEQLLDAATAKIATGRGSIARAFKKIDPEGWDSFNNNILKRRATFLADAIIPIENIVQRIGILVIRNIDFTLKASNRDDLSRFISSARVAFDGNHIIANPKELEGIRVALARIQANEELFEKATEGIVFKWKDGKTRKLTGMFTPINKLRGFFAYGGAQISGGDEVIQTVQERVESAWSRMINEGGNAFKDATGRVITRSERIPREEVSPIVASFVRDILDPLGMDHIGVGTTVTNFPDVGDIDVVVDAKDAKDVKEKLSAHPDLQVELEEAPGINRLYMLPGGSGIAVLYKVPLTGELVQVDVMPSKGVALDDVGWMLAGAPEGGVKGRYRNILLSWIAKNMSERESAETGDVVKYTYARGLLKKVNNVPIGSRETDPDVFLPSLGINTHKKELRSFEGLVTAMRANPELSAILPGFREYISNRSHLLSTDPARAAEANAAADYIDGVLNEVVRLSIRRLLTEEDEGDDDIALHASGLPTGDETDSPSDMTHITTDWLRRNSVTAADHPAAAAIYKPDTNSYYADSIPYLLLGYEDAAEEREGEQFEAGIIDYTAAQFPGTAKATRIGGEGEDLSWNGVRYESKKSKTNSPTLMFNSTFPKASDDLYYLFTTNVPNRAQIKEILGEIRTASGDRFMEDWKNLGPEDRSAMASMWRDEMESYASEQLKVDKHVKELQASLDTWDDPSRLAVQGDPVEDLSDREEEVNLKREITGQIKEAKIRAMTVKDHDGNDITFTSKKSFKDYISSRKALISSSSDSFKRLKNLGFNMKVYIVPSTVLRKTIVDSAFPGIFDSVTGKPDAEKLVKQIKDYLDNFGLEYKIANKIAPQLVQELVSGLESPHEKGWSMNMGLLNVRVKIYIEPKKAV